MDTSTQKDRHKQPVSYPLRMPPHVRAALDREAQRNLRSLNGEIVLRLQRSLEQHEQAEASVG